MLELLNKRDMAVNEKSQFCFTITQVYLILELSVSNAPNLGKLKNEYMDKAQTSSMF